MRMTSTQRSNQPEVAAPAGRFRRRTAVAGTAVLVTVLVVAGMYAAGWWPGSGAGPAARQDDQDSLTTKTGSYLGLYADGVPSSTAGIRSFSAATGVSPDLAVYYSGWLEPFQTSFASSASRSGAVPLVQINPAGVRVAAIAAGRYDGYLRSYAAAVNRYRYPVVLSFGHEMNGYWYSWAAGHTAPATFVRAWRHIVDVFRATGTQNVTWLWTVNTIQTHGRVASPRPWWPGDSYVTWVGIDGYYYSSSTKFSALFGPTIASVRTWTSKPVLFTETSATPSAGQPAKIADLFAGIHLYGLLGFVWFNHSTNQDWRLTSPAAIAAFRRAARDYRPTP